MTIPKCNQGTKQPENNNKMFSDSDDEYPYVELEEVDDRLFHKNSDCVEGRKYRIFSTIAFLLAVVLVIVSTIPMYSDEQWSDLADALRSSLRSGTYEYEKQLNSKLGSGFEAIINDTSAYYNYAWGDMLSPSTAWTKTKAKVYCTSYLENIRKKYLYKKHDQWRRSWSSIVEVYVIYPFGKLLSFIFSITHLNPSFKSLYHTSRFVIIPTRIHLLTCCFLIVEPLFIIVLDFFHVDIVNGYLWMFYRTYVENVDSNKGHVLAFVLYILLVAPFSYVWNIWSRFIRRFSDSPRIQIRNKRVWVSFVCFLFETLFLLLLGYCGWRVFVIFLFIILYLMYIFVKYVLLVVVVLLVVLDFFCDVAFFWVGLFYYVYVMKVIG